jgi:predicted NUDIX family phosphoesterase/thymidylate kinase
MFQKKEEKKENEVIAIIKEMESLAEKVLKLKKHSIPRRPIVIEFCGSPKSGKSSCINSLSLFLRRNGFKTRVLTERASVCPITDKYDPSFNIWTACSAIAELVEVISNSSKKYDVIILDRGIFDALCWFNWLKENNSLDSSDFQSLEAFLVMDKWRTLLDLIYVFTATPDVSLQREYASLLTRKPGSIMCTDALVSYKGCIEKASNSYSNKFQKIKVYDTSLIGLNDVNHDVTKKILEIIQKNIAEKIGYIPRSKLNNISSETFYLKEEKLSNLSLKYALRGDVEVEEESVQPIPILIVTNKERNKMLVVKKNKKTTSKISPESNKLLIYLGGHTREEDSFNTNSKGLLSLSKLTLTREIKEETGINYIPSENEDNPLCIWVRDNDRSKKHFAICYIMEVNFSRTKFKLDKNEFMTGGNTKSGMILSLQDVVKREKELESWSKLIIREVFGQSLTKTPKLL